MKVFSLLVLLFASSAYAKPCGLQGSVEERIKDCATEKENFSLIARDDSGIEIYKDTKSNLIWGNRIPMDFNHYGSQKACDENPEAKVLNLKWRLPTLKEFEVASSHGIKLALPNMNNWFWTSTPAFRARKGKRRRRAQPARVFLWDGMEEVSDTGDLKDGASVRCVAKE